VRGIGCPHGVSYSVACYNKVMSDTDPMADVINWGNTPDELPSRLADLIKRGQTISAINVYREHHHIGLTDAHLAIVRLTECTKVGPPCPECGKPLRTALAQQCLECGADWHYGSSH